MEYLVGIIVLLFGGLVFFKKKAERAEVNEKLAETKGRDAELQIQQITLQDALNQIDQNIEAARAEREAQRIKDENMTLKERADRIKKGLS